jgi:hypothetical protein
VVPQAQAGGSDESGGAGGDPNGSAGGSSTSSSEAKDSSRLVVIVAILGAVAALLLVGTLWIVLKRRAGRARVEKHLGLEALDGDGDTDSYSPRLSSSQASPSRFRIVGTAASRSNLSSPNGSPNRPTRAFSDEDFRSLSGVVSLSGVLSLEESLFTTNDAGITSTRAAGAGDVVVVDPPSDANAYLQYDHTRLDEVIASAKGITERRETETEEPL